MAIEVEKWSQSWHGCEPLAQLAVTSPELWNTCWPLPPPVPVTWPPLSLDPGSPLVKAKCERTVILEGSRPEDDAQPFTVHTCPSQLWLETFEVAESHSWSPRSPVSRLGVRARANQGWQHKSACLCQGYVCLYRYRVGGCLWVCQACGPCHPVGRAQLSHLRPPFILEEGKEGGRKHWGVG